jgi:uncharacterized protein YfiM (DUF2279 family)
MGQIIKLALAAFALAFAVAAGAADSWTGQDKVKHLSVSAVLGVAAGAVTDNTAAAVALALVPGLLKEAYDSQHRSRHTPSWRDMGANVIGAVLGVGVARWSGLTISPGWVSWSTRF